MGDSEVPHSVSALTAKARRQRSNPKPLSSGREPRGNIHKPIASGSDRIEKRTLDMSNVRQKNALGAKRGAKNLAMAGVFFGERKARASGSNAGNKGEGKGSKSTSYQGVTKIKTTKNIVCDRDKRKRQKGRGGSQNTVECEET